jgi:trehalose-6-phosphate synthase
MISMIVGIALVAFVFAFLQVHDTMGQPHLLRNTFLRTLVQVALMALITLLIIHWSIGGPIARTAQWLRAMRTGNSLEGERQPEADFLRPLAQEVTHLVKSLESARAVAEEEARLREASESLWTAERLRASVRSKIQDSPLFVVSNREPYMHIRRGKAIETIVPASGLVTALEPILHACNGTWIAHGAGDADRDTVDAHDRLRVPPEQPQYTLRRVWLTKEEEEGYYYGFANEGLWPLCHIAHTRPVFRASDWAAYEEANRKFARAVLEEMAGVDQAVLLVQDYHFALLPKLVKEERPDARVAIFWHIPWPNPEAFGICPWQRELLDGLLGADLVSFHIQAHCNNFLETVERALEAQVEWERFAVRRGGHVTLVRPFPISVDFREAPQPSTPPTSAYVERAAHFKELGVTANFLGIGVDRVDYTKGIIERFRGIERFFEKWPDYRGKFTFVQIGSPSRTHIKRYHDLLGEVEAEAERINWRFRSGSWKPLALLTRHHSHQEIDHYYRAADLCLVTSLHDGMNLVAKEFVAARYDEGGALILSQFTGASRELGDALVVNPYDTEQIADAIRLALEMEPEERQARMRRMRHIVKERNVYRWAGTLISELCEIRPEKVEAASGRPA